MNRILLSAAAVCAVSHAASAQTLRERLAPAPHRTLEDAADILTELAKVPEKAIPPALLTDAGAVAIIPNVVKAGFVVAGRGGHGVLLVKDKAGIWGDPVFLNLGGGSVGFQAGVEATDVVLVFKDRKSADRLLDGKGKLTLGADASVAAGPLGRQATAGTDAKLAAEIYSYSRSRGLFAGVALDGTVVRPDETTNAKYKADPRPETVKSLTNLKNVLTTLSTAEPPVRK